MCEVKGIEEGRVRGACCSIAGGLYWVTALRENNRVTLYTGAYFLYQFNKGLGGGEG